MTQASGIAVVAFTAPTGGLYPQDQTIDLTPASGQTPKAAIFILQGDEALDAIGTTGDAARLSVGFTDGSTHRAVAFFGENAVLAANADTGYRVDTDTVVQLTTVNTPNLLAEAAFDSFATDAVTITWTADPGARRGYVVFFYGATLEANVTSFATETDGSTSTTDPGFTPDILFACSVGQAFVADGGDAEGMISFGFSARLPSITQACASIVAEDRQSATSSGCIARDDSIIAILTSVAATVTNTQNIAVSSYDANGFTLASTAGLSVEAMYLSIKGFSGHVAAAATDVTSTGAHSVTGLSFRPLGLCILGNRNANANTAANQAGGMSIGFATGLNVAAGAGVHFRDNQATSEGASTVSSTDIVLLPSSTTAYDWKADFDSFDQAGFTYNVNDAAAANRVIPYLVLGPAPIVTSETENISDAFVLKLNPLRVSDDTEQIGDAFVLVRKEALSETENIQDNFAFVAKQTSGDTEQISENALLLLGNIRALSETEQISDGFVTVVMASAAASVFSETEQISDGFVLVQRNAILSLTDTEQISENALLILGRVMVSTDTEQIIDQMNSGAGLLALKRTLRGTVFE